MNDSEIAHLTKVNVLCRKISLRKIPTPSNLNNLWGLTWNRLIAHVVMKTSRLWINCFYNVRQLKRLGQELQGGGVWIRLAATLIFKYKGD